MKNIKFGVFLIILLLVMNGIYNATKKTDGALSNDKMHVSTSFYPLYFFSTQIGGDKVDVYNITPASSEPHDYEPTARDIAQIQKSKLLILNGGKLEAWSNKIKEELYGKNIVIITAADGITNQQDPHIWLSPLLAKQEVDNILQGFIQADRNNKDYYMVHAHNLKLRLAELDKKYRNGLMTCDSKNFVTSHAAFGHLAKTYGLNQVSISGLSPDEEPSTRHLATIADFARQNNVKYIFFESLVSPKLSETVATEIGAQTLVLDPIEGMTKDAMKQGKNYFTIMEDNLKNLQKALGCK